MYPWLRLTHTFITGRSLPTMGIHDTHVSQHRVSLLDCDIFLEMNNGRILTMYEMGRFQMAQRIGLWQILREREWGFAVAGASIRYRKRLVPFERYEMRTKLVGWDDRFTYFEQGMFKRSGECASHVLFRTAVVHKHRGVPTSEVAVAIGAEEKSPELPAWITAWTEAEAQRPWPPMQN
ncbi:MAG: acyl-CoA thioesterase [Pseudomonadota bacterium]